VRNCSAIISSSWRWLALGGAPHRLAEDEGGIRAARRSAILREIERRSGDQSLNAVVIAASLRRHAALRASPPGGDRQELHASCAGTAPGKGRGAPARSALGRA